jgi:hypothetical protein
MEMKNKLLAVLCFILVCSFTSFIPVQAASNSSAITITITPSITEELVKPGDVISRSINLTNKSDKELTFYAYLKDFRAATGDETGRVQLLDPGSEEGNFISSWINISGDSIAILPGQTQSIPFTVTVPSNVGPGGYYGAIVFGTQAPKTEPGEADKGAAIGVAQEVTSLVLLQVPGTADERADIREFKTDKNFYSTPFTVNFSTKIQNFGNVHVRPVGEIDITNMFNKKVASLTVNDADGNILPASTRLFTNTWKDSFGFGRYQAALSLSYGTPADQGGEGMKSLTMYWYFWILPVKILVYTGLSLLIIAALFVVFLRFYRKMAVSSAMQRMGMKEGHVLKKKKTPRVRNEFILTLSILAGIAAAAIIILYFILF